MNGDSKKDLQRLAKNLGWHVYTISISDGSHRHYLRSPFRIPFNNGEPVVSRRMSTDEMARLKIIPDEISILDHDVHPTISSRSITLRFTEDEAWDDLPDDKSMIFHYSSPKSLS